MTVKTLAGPMAAAKSTANWYCGRLMLQWVQTFLNQIAVTVESK